MTSKIRSCSKRAPSRPILMTYPIPAEGIEWEILQENIHTFLGPEAYARVHINQGDAEQYLITTTKPFTKSQLNDLRAFSAEMIEEDAGYFEPERLDHPNIAQIHQRYDSSISSRNHINGYDNYQRQGGPIQLQINFPITQYLLIASTTEPYNPAITCHSCLQRGISERAQEEFWERRNRPFDSVKSDCTSETLH